MPVLVFMASPRLRWCGKPDWEALGVVGAPVLWGGGNPVSLPRAAPNQGVHVAAEKAQI